MTKYLSESGQREEGVEGEGAHGSREVMARRFRRITSLISRVTAKSISGFFFTTEAESPD